MITEFGLSAPNLSRHEKSEFSYQTRSVTSLYQRVFGKRLKVGKAWKLLVEVVPKIMHERHRDLIGVLVVQVSGDPNELLKADGRAKQELALKWLISGTDSLAAELGIEKFSFQAAAEKVRSLDFVNLHTWKSVANPRKDRIVEIVVDHGIHEAKIIGRFLTRDGKLIRQQLLTKERPDELVFGPLIGELNWINDYEAELCSKVSGKLWRISADGLSE